MNTQQFEAITPEGSTSTVHAPQRST
jgi:hypothetical protein